MALIEKKIIINVYMFPGLEEALSSLNLKIDTIMAEQTQLAAQMREVSTQLAKVRDEILAKVAELEAALDAADDVSPEVQEAFDALKAQVQGLDDINPDEPITTTTVEPTTTTEEPTTTTEAPENRIVR